MDRACDHSPVIYRGRTPPKITYYNVAVHFIAFLLVIMMMMVSVESVSAAAATEPWDDEGKGKEEEKELIPNPKELEQNWKDTIISSDDIDSSSSSLPWMDDNNDVCYEKGSQVAPSGSSETDQILHQLLCGIRRFLSSQGGSYLHPGQGQSQDQQNRWSNWTTTGWYVMAFIQFAFFTFLGYFFYKCGKRTWDCYSYSRWGGANAKNELQQQKNEWTIRDYLMIIVICLLVPFIAWIFLLNKCLLGVFNEDEFEEFMQETMNLPPLPSSQNISGERDSSAPDCEDSDWSASASSLFGKIRADGGSGCCVGCRAAAWNSSGVGGTPQKRTGEIADGNGNNGSSSPEVKSSSGGGGESSSNAADVAATAGGVNMATEKMEEK